MKTILVVDDDPMALTLVRDVLRAAGYDVMTAQDGPTGIQIAISKKPNLILLDLMMPKMDGYQTLAQLRGNKATVAIPVIMVTAVGYELNKTLASTMGAQDYIVKPVDIVQLRSKVAQYLKA